MKTPEQVADETMAKFPTLVIAGKRFVPATHAIIAHIIKLDRLEVKMSELKRSVGKRVMRQK
jgi:hypothetical protein